MYRILFFCLLLTACTKEVDLDLDNADPLLVIDGAITNQPGPYRVTISKTVPFSASNQYPPVTGATVSISDDAGHTETLAETAPGIYETATLTGTPGQTYTLLVNAEGKSFHAVSTMPLPVLLDSLDFELFTNNGNTGGKEWLTHPIFTDPITPGNAYRMLQTINGKADKSIYVLNDNTFNGARNEQLLFNPDNEIQSGDTVRTVFRCTDKPSYDYFFTLSQVSDGPFSATPSNPPSNITGGVALGLFSAYTVQEMTKMVP